MKPRSLQHGAAPRWDVVQPVRRVRPNGVSITGFRNQGAGAIDLPLIPYPAITVILECGDGSLTVNGGTDRSQRGSLVSGLHTGAMRMSGTNIECVEVRLSPVVAYRVLGVPLVEMAGGVVPADAVWGRAADRVRQQLGDAPTWDDRFAATEALLTRHGRDRPSVDREVAWAWDQLIVSRGGLRVEHLAESIGWSRKRLWSRFRSQIGLPPKHAVRLFRFSHAAQGLAAGDNAAQVAADCGFADQSHLHREVLAFTGMTPTSLAGAPELVLEDTTRAEGTFVQDPR
ncbi:helix-turn-helix domain-containing protein [Mycobacterium sp. CPCC 205372]|uniref:Helix-turn-helix domain-containing protein n=1 Tax=Mycobacterium hippophais TaxID=3016340 RepID=A0ABT4PTX1_9MYCO|nr:helix-turn-helix domain-containing protein [Mycobacterium hippophais]MCZ8379985.1 helix-turn-helix domain-containing protein [Mycobacterium hippophais]